MEIALIISLKDTAAININNNLLKHFDFKPCKDHHLLKLSEHALRIYQVDQDSINCENIDKEIDADLFVFPTKHQSASGINSFSVHSPGNWFKAEYGGKDNALCVCPANILKKALNLLELKADHSKYDVVQEVTHHGPHIEKPIMFIEIGSNGASWENEEAGKVIAETIIEIFNSEIKEYESAFGIGGLHTTPNFKKIVLGSKYSIGHVCPKYMLDHLTKERIVEAMEKTVPRSNLVMLDWKGLKENKQKIIQMLDELKIKHDRTDKF